MEDSKKERIIMTIQWSLWWLFPFSTFVEQVKFTFLKPYGYFLLISGFVLFIFANKAHGSTNKLKLSASPKPNNSAKLVTRGVYA